MKSASRFGLRRCGRRRRKPNDARRVRLNVEALESRQLLSALSVASSRPFRMETAQFGTVGKQATVRFEAQLSDSAIHRAKPFAGLRPGQDDDGMGTTGVSAR